MEIGMKSALLYVWITTLSATFSLGSVFAQDAKYSPDAPAKSIRIKPSARKFLEQTPDDLEIKVTLKSKKPVVGQIRYGSPNSVRIAFVVDQPGEATDQFDLYVDSDRDRVIQDDEKVDGSGRVRELLLKTQIANGNLFNNHERKVRFRRSIDPRIFNVATYGGYASTCEIDGQSIDVWRTDGNGNGLFSDRDDEVWLDKNGDGKFSQIAERHLYRPVIAFGQKRFAVRGDECGARIAFEPIVGEGILELDASLDDDVNIESFVAKIYGDDGSCYSIGADQKLMLPVGKYTIGQVGIRISQNGELPWSFSFSHTGKPSQQRWHEVTKDESVSASIFHSLKLDFTCPDKAIMGEKLAIQPVLTTADHLFLTSCYRGKTDAWGMQNMNSGVLGIRNESGTSIGTATSGFA